MRTLRAVLLQTKGIWSRLDGGQKLVVGALLFATLAGLGGTVWFARQTAHEPATAANGNGPAHVEPAVAAIAALDGEPAVNVSGGSAEFLRLQRSLGEERTRLAQQRLDQLWPGKTSVVVNLELDPTWETRSEKVLPEEPIVRSETRDSTDSSNGGTADSERGKSKTLKREREFVTDIGERRTGRMAPEIKRLTVAVLYDRSLAHAPGFVEQDLVNAVKAIVGWDPARDEPEAFRTLAGDFASIDHASIAAVAPGIAEVLLQWGPTIGPILGVLVVFVFLRALFRRARPPAVAPAAPAAAEVKEEDMSPEQRQQHLRAEIEQSIANDPAALARILESWLGEQKA